MNHTEPKLNPVFSEYASTEAYLKQLINSPSSASSMDLELARLNKHLAEDDRANTLVVTALGLTLLSAILVLAAYWPMMLS